MQSVKNISKDYRVLEDLTEKYFYINLSFKKTTLLGRVRWLKPEIPALWEAKAGGSLDQEFETILVNMVKPRLY